ncbi:hypothetical protein BXT89_12565 [Halopseudomonas pachastrellae]|uniref:Uncharacterized protein n=1 Tax=Halopseudomonas pachastrellae TaxID=254161 RepID=A0A1S8DFQ6_9GAMM|nr:hypothetical protein BXT89_12565 [Halopseudomonas pachastrellae]WVM90238.1 hypothetical protein UMZ34_08385 [Halopseudomonas pachastrellae]
MDKSDERAGWCGVAPIADLPLTCAAAPSLRKKLTSCTGFDRLEQAVGAAGPVKWWLQGR